MIYNNFSDISPPEGGYRIIHADPPWNFRDKAKAGKRGAESHYQCLTTEKLRQFPVPEIAASSCLLALWHVSTMPREALSVVESWGFTFKLLKGFTWVKLTKHGKHHFGMGSYTRANSEDCLFAIRGKTGDIIQNKGVSQLIFAKRNDHSAKPMEAQERLVKLCGDVPRIELFARREIEGWDCFGDEICSLGELAENDQSNDVKKPFGRHEADQFQFPFP